MRLRGSARSLHPDGLDKPAGQSDGGGTGSTAAVRWQRCSRFQRRLEQLRSASDCDPACGCVCRVLTVCARLQWARNGETGSSDDGKEAAVGTCKGSS